MNTHKLSAEKVIAFGMCIAAIIIIACAVVYFINNPGVIK